MRNTRQCFAVTRQSFLHGLITKGKAPIAFFLCCTLQYEIILQISKNITETFIRSLLYYFFCCTLQYQIILQTSKILRKPSLGHSYVTFFVALCNTKSFYKLQKMFQKPSLGHSYIAFFDTAESKTYSGSCQIYKGAIGDDRALIASLELFHKQK